jgi:hypothetical protein
MLLCGTCIYIHTHIFVYTKYTSKNLRMYVIYVCMYVSIKPSYGFALVSQCIHAPQSKTFAQTHDTAYRNMHAQKEKQVMMHPSCHPANQGDQKRKTILRALLPRIMPRARRPSPEIHNDPCSGERLTLWQILGPAATLGCPCCALSAFSHGLLFLPDHI